MPVSTRMQCEETVENILVLAVKAGMLPHHAQLVYRPPAPSRREPARVEVYVPAVGVVQLREDDNFLPVFPPGMNGETVLLVLKSMESVLRQAVRRAA